MNPSYLPYSAQQLDEADIAQVVEVLRGQWLTQGPVVARFESALCERFGARHAVAVSSGTAALHLACRALGVAAGDEVITSPNTFVASANCVLYCGGVVKFADIDPETYNLCPAALQNTLSAVSNRALKGIIPVHFAGRPCEMEQIHELAQARGLWVLEDACHAPGSRWRDRDGRWHTVGDCSHSDAVCLSFHPVKHFTTGEGGAILTNRSDLYDCLVRLRSHGITRDPSLMSDSHGPWYHQMIELGYNYRLTDFQCALGLSQLKRLDDWLARRRAMAAAYDEHLADLAMVKLPARADHLEHAYHLYVVQVPQRRRVLEHLQSVGVGCQVHYVPVHTQPYYQSRFGYCWGDFPAAERYYARSLSLPLFPAMTELDVKRVVAALAQALDHAPATRAA